MKFGLSDKLIDSSKIIFKNNPQIKELLFMVLVQEETLNQRQILI